MPFHTAWKTHLSASKATTYTATTKKTASVDAATTTYLDAVSNRAAETRNYYVTAVYDKGESMPLAKR